MKLTKRTVEALKPANGEILVWDDDLRGFGIRVKASGVRAYVLQYRNAAGRSRRMTIGRHGVVTAEAARKHARSVLADVARGKDPASDRVEKRDAGTLRAFSERYLREHAETKKKASSLRSDRWLLKQHILPRLGAIPIGDLARRDVVALHHAMRSTPNAANRARSLLSKMMNLAEKWGVQPDGSNPCRHVEPFAEKKRRRFLLADELARLGAVLAAAEREESELPSVVPAIRLLLLTGARVGEILGLRWDQVDAAAGLLRLADSKTGAKEVPLSAPALAVIAALPSDESPWVIPGRRADAPLVGLNHAWHRIRERAGLEDVTLHDLRRTAASAGASVGLALETVGQILGHTQAQTTKRYAFLFADAKREGADRIGAWLDSALRARPGAKVVRLHRGRADGTA